MPSRNPEESFRARLITNEKRAWLRPMTTGEVIDTALRLYQRTAWLILGLTAVPTLLCYSALVFFEVAVLPGLFTTKAPGQFSAEIAELAVVLTVCALVAGPLFCLGLAWSTGVVVSVTQSVLHGSTPNRDSSQASGRASMVVVAKTLGKTLLISTVPILLAGVFLAVGFMLENNKSLGGFATVVASLAASGCVLVGTIAFPLAWNIHALVPVVCVIEKLDAKASMKRSRSLMGYHRGHPSGSSVTFSIGFLLLLVGAPLLVSLMAVLELTQVSEFLRRGSVPLAVGQMLDGLIRGVPWYLTLWLLLPLWSCAMTVLYYDRIVRYEAYDVSMMLEDIKNEGRRSVLLR